MPTARAFRYNPFAALRGFPLQSLSQIQNTKRPTHGPISSHTQVRQTARKAVWTRTLIGYGWAIGPIQHTKYKYKSKK